MHELSIVMSIVEQVEEEVRKRDAHKVNRIEFDIGDMAGIEWDSFDFAWEPAIKNTVLAEAERIINHIPAKAQCMDCEHEFEKKEAYDECPNCGHFMHHLKSGKELKIKSLVIT